MTQEQLLKFLEQKYGRAQLANKGFIRIPCPTCIKKNKVKLKRYVSSTTNFTQCYICQVPLTREDIVGDNVIVETTTKNELSRSRVEHPQAKILPFQHCIPINCLPSDHPAVRFLAKDHLFKLDTYWNDYKIGFVPHDGGVDVKFSEKFTAKTMESLIFPVIVHGELVGWQLRYVPGTWNGDRMSFMRYFHLFDKGNYLFNYDNAKKSDTVIVVEGAKKALKHPHAVATLGKGISERQIQLLCEWKTVVLMLDGDPATQEYSRKLAQTIKAMPRNCINIDLSKHGFPSPDEMTSEQVEKLVNEYTIRGN